VILSEGVELLEEIAESKTPSHAEEKAAEEDVSEVEQNSEDDCQSNLRRRYSRES
jgi:hypothetical protein